MNWVDYIIIVLLIISFFGGFKDGGFKSLFSLITTIVAIPVAGVTYFIPSWILSFLPGENWEHFLGFGVAFVVVILVFRIPMEIVIRIGKRRKGIFESGCLDRIFGGAIGVFSGLIGALLFSLVIVAYPILRLQASLIDSRIVSWLADYFIFVPSMLPETFKDAVNLIRLGL